MSDGNSVKLSMYLYKDIFTMPVIV